MFLGVLVRCSLLCATNYMYCFVFTEFDHDGELAGLLAHVDGHCGGGYIDCADKCTVNQRKRGIG